MMSINMTTPTYLLKLLMPRFRQRASKGQRSGIINVGSQFAHAPCENLAAYSGTKHYIEGLTLALGEELKDDMDVLLANPGPVKTSMRAFNSDPDTIMPDQAVQGYLKQLGQERHCSGHYIHDLVEYYLVTLRANLPVSIYLSLIAFFNAQTMKKVKRNIFNSRALMGI